jgi:hypothetical protein
MKRIKPNYHTLKELNTSTSTLRKAIISNCKSDLLKVIPEFALNLLRGNVNLKDCQMRNLQKYRAILRRLADKSVPLSSKKRSLVQRDGFLLPLLCAVLATVASLIFQIGDRYRCYGKCILYHPII